MENETTEHPCDVPYRIASGRRQVEYGDVDVFRNAKFHRSSFGALVFAAEVVRVFGVRQPDQRCESHSVGSAEDGRALIATKVNEVHGSPMQRSEAVSQRLPPCQTDKC